MDNSMNCGIRTLRLIESHNAATARYNQQMELVGLVYSKYFADLLRQKQAIENHLSQTYQSFLEKINVSLKIDKINDTRTNNYNHQIANSNNKCNNSQSPKTFQSGHKTSTPDLNNSNSLINDITNHNQFTSRIDAINSKYNSNSISYSGISINGADSIVNSGMKLTATISTT